MDETMRTIIAYAVTVLGIPRFIAKILWFVPGAVVGTVLAKFSDPLGKMAGGGVEGFISILLVSMFFNHLNVHLVWEVPLILIAVNSILEWGKDEPYAAWSAIAGIVIGFFLYPGILDFLIQRLGPEHLSSMKGWAGSLLS